MSTKSTQPAPTKVQLDQGKTIAAHAIRMADKVNGNEHLLGDLNTYSDALELTKRGPLSFLFSLRKEIGDEEMDTWPVVGLEDTQQTPTNNPDVYRRPGVNSKNKPTLVRESFYDKLSDNTSHGRDAHDKLAAIEKRQSNKDGIPSELDADATVWQGRINAFRRLFKTAVRIYQQWQAVATPGAFPKVKWSIFMVTDPATNEKKLRRTTEPFMLMDPENPSNYRTLTIGMFLSLSPQRAEEAGGTVEAFMTTRGVEPEVGEGDDINNPDDFEAYSNAVASWIMDKNNFALIQKIMDKKEKDGKTPTPAALEMIETVGDINAAVNILIAKYDRVYNAICDKRDAVTNAAGETEKAA